ncbi:efflux RND transporter periplasmic adaptor subunit [Bifidobacterium amazonense]|uniref:Efflux RND transporter periplasmic adaptor subunit n=1 Tax=Bifidobacterium amazonense TaxID=2809027 RepID=A0ABS9VWX1_9BIFI|nr:efflux RND transporter periplasmic adaptor subunit [Bifidobacterium amazonense]MCH9276612.1 efflux RND transporter periplasmic adaptor subunit [Bifidobacterium amazonense]
MTACSPQSSSADTTSTASGATSTVEVRKGGITPLVSSSTSVQLASLFALTAPVKGWFHATADQGTYVHAGDQLGVIDNQSVTTPVDGVIESVTQDNDVAEHYPLFSIRYGGMSAEVDATAMLTIIGSDQRLAGRFQITDAQGPTDCAAIVDDGAVMPASSEQDTAGSSAGPQGAESTRTLQCLFPKDVQARPGQNAVVVLTAPTIEDALILPVTAVAGRLGSGQVSKRDGDSFTTVNVKLGASDGTSIIILDGLKEGDTVASTAPNLAPGAQS